MEGADDTSGPFSFQLLQLAKLHVQPAVIYAPAKADAALLDALRAPLLPPPDVGAGATAAAVTASAMTREFEVRLERSTHFHIRQALATLEAVHVRDWGGSGGQQQQHWLDPRERLHHLHACLDLSREQQVCAAGALLAVLAREGRLATTGSGATATAAAAAAGVAEAGGPAPLLCVASVREVSLGGHLAVDPASLAALQVFQEEAHPAAALGIGACRAVQGGAGQDVCVWQ